MSEQETDATVVTRNIQHDKYAELKLLADVLGMVGFVYYLTHPDVFDRLTDRAKESWQTVVHRVSVWAARQDIRSLPETDE